MIRPFVSFFCSAFYSLYCWASSVRRSPRESLLQSGEISPEEERLLLLSSLVRRFPYWRKGHLFIAELYFRLGNIEQSYSACHTALILYRGAPEVRQLKLLKCRVYLSVGRFKEVETLLLDGRDEESLSPSELEVLAAAYMGLEELGKAERVLGSLSSSDVGGATEAPLRYLKQRADPVKQSVIKSTE